MSINSKWTACHKCNRGGNGNDPDKCSCGWKITDPSVLGCYLGTPIVGTPTPPKPLTASQRRYRRFLEYGDGFDSFREYLRWDCDPERSWNGPGAEEGR